MVLKDLPYSLPSSGREADHCTDSRPAGDFKSSPGSKLPLVSARPAVTFQRMSPSFNQLYCLVTEAHRCEQLAQVAIHCTGEN